MSDATPVKRGMTLAWSIGLGVLFLGITTVLLLPATKSARVRFDKNKLVSPSAESTNTVGDRAADGGDAMGDHAKDNDAVDNNTEDQSKPGQAP